MSRPIVILDTETGGMDPSTDPLIEVAWTVYGSGEYHVFVVPHDPERVHPAAAAVNRYYERRLGDPNGWGNDADTARLRETLAGATLAGANPPFDAGFLEVLLGEKPWHYRLLDVEAMAWGAMPKQFDEMPGLKHVANLLREHGYAIPEPDHSALGDIKTTEAILSVLLDA